METTLQQPENPFQKPGEICESCKEFWESQNLSPRTMVSIGKDTDERGIEIVVCPHCDGYTILRLNHQ